MIGENNGKIKIRNGMAMTIVCTTLVLVFKRFFFDEMNVVEAYRLMAEAPLTLQNFFIRYGFELFIGCALILTAIIHKTRSQSQRNVK